MSKTRLTQRDVARKAGVSQAAVSYVLNGSNDSAVSEVTRQRVLAAMEELGYVPDGIARGMRTGRTMLIGAVIPDITNPFYPAFQRGMQDAADEAGYSVVSFNSDGARARELASIRAALQVGVDGLVVSLFETTTEDLNAAFTRNIPVVVYGTLADDRALLPYDLIEIDIPRAVDEVVQHLVQRRHTAIAVVDGPQLRTRANPRIGAFQDAMRTRGLAVDERLLLRTEFSEQGGYQAMDRLLSLERKPTAIIAANDVVAMGLLTKAEEAGVAIPGDIAIVGYDDIPAARLLRPALTTVALHPETIGQRSVELLLDRLSRASTAPGRREFLPHRLVIRDST